MSAAPLVSIVIPACNAEAFIEYTFRSVLAQTYQNFEVIVVDDGSRDCTLEIIESFMQKDSRIRLFKQQNAGVGAARNLAMQEAKGKYIAPIDADDIWFPQKLEKQVSCLENADESVGLVYSWSVYLNEAGEMTNYSPFGKFGRVEGNVFKFLVFYNFLDNGSTMMFRRSCVDRVSGYRCDLKTCEDWEFYIRVAEHYQFCIVPEYLIGYRQYFGSISSNCTAMAHFHELVMDEAYQRHPELQRYIRCWSNTVFYNNLLGKSYLAGDYKNALRWIYRILKGDRALLLRPGIYKAIPVSILGLLARFLANRKYQPPVRKEQKVSISSQEILTPEPPKNIRFWKPYDRILLKRWKHMLQTV
jgi:glycosyltransferase involved in cell wall biosynthesis